MALIVQIDNQDKGDQWFEIAIASVLSSKKSQVDLVDIKAFLDIVDQHINRH